MRLLYVCSDFGIAPNGTKGASIHLRSITRHLAALGHEVLLLTPKPALHENHPAQLLVTESWSVIRETSRHLKSWLTGHGFQDAVAREIRPLLYNTWAVDKALDALRGNPPDAIIERLSLFGHVGVDLADALDVPLVVEVNAPLTSEAGSFRSLHLASLAEQIEQRVLRRADAVLAVSEPLADLLVQAGIERTKIDVVPNGVELSLFDKAPQREACRSALDLNGNFVVGFVGSLKVWHGVDVLLGAFEKLHGVDSTVRLLIVGTGPEEAVLREKVKAMGLEKAVRFTGAVEHDRIPSLLQAMDVAVAPFNTPRDGCFYFSPIKLFEYMAAGVCVVASDLGQIRQVIEDGVNGLLCQPDSTDSLFAAIRKAKEHPEACQKMGDAALECVRRDYTWVRAAKTTERVVRARVEEMATRRLEQAGRTSDTLAVAP